MQFAHTARLIHRQNRIKYNSQQLRFVNTIIDYLTQNGVMSPAMLAKPPFSDIHFEGVFGLFGDGVVMDLRNKIKEVEARAVGEQLALPT